MAYGVIKVIPTLTHQQILVASGNVPYASARVLNPNDGVLYVARNRDCLTADYGAWEWKIPSQSFAILPGETPGFSTLGLYYRDTSGSGAAGEVTIYPSFTVIEDPTFIAIGRAGVTVQTIMDITEGPKPVPPPIGICRIWADGSGVLYHEHSDGSNPQIIDTITPLGGVLAGTLPNPTFPTYLQAGGSGGTNAYFTNLTINRGDNVGLLFFVDGVHYLQYSMSANAFIFSHPVLMNGALNMNGYPIQNYTPVVDTRVAQSNTGKNCPPGTWTISNFQLDLPAGTWACWWTCTFQSQGGGTFPYAIDVNMWSWNGSALVGEYGARQWVQVSYAVAYWACGGFGTVTGPISLVLGAYPSGSSTTAMSPGNGGAYSRIMAMRVA